MFCRGADMKGFVSLVVLVATGFFVSLSPSLAAEVKSVRDCADCPEMIVIPPGTFQMGRDDGEPERYEGPVRTITIKHRFAVGKYEVTIGDFAKFVEETGFRTQPGCMQWDGKSAFFDIAATWDNPKLPGPQSPQWPVVCVTWFEAKAYAEWLSKKAKRPYRLLSEAEWEYVASEGKGQMYPWGPSPDGGCKVANMYDQSAVRAGLNRPVKAAECDDGQPYVAKVGSLTPNAFGVHDINGNIWEWIEDCYVMPYPATGLDGRPIITQPECYRHGNRGGSWTSDAARHRVTFRGRDPGFLRSQSFGIRVARDD
jgi:formylglycine-generating enzyme required for sulfatase activity